MKKSAAKELKKIKAPGILKRNFLPLRRNKKWGENINYFHSSAYPRINHPFRHQSCKKFKNVKFESRHAFLDLLDEPTKCFHLRPLEFLIDRLNSPAFLYRLAPCVRRQNAETKYVCIKLKSKVRLHFNLRGLGIVMGQC